MFDAIYGTTWAVSLRKEIKFADFGKSMVEK